jgi:hypothetical protein
LKSGQFGITLVSLSGTEILKGFSRLLRRSKYIKKRQEAFKVILKILRRKSKN